MKKTKTSRRKWIEGRRVVWEQFEASQLLGKRMDETSCWKRRRRNQTDQCYLLRLFIGR